MINLDSPFACSFIDYFKDLHLRDGESSGDVNRLTSVSHLHVEGRQHPVKIFYLRDPTPCYITEARKTVFKLHENRPLGADILVFLTGKSTRFKAYLTPRIYARCVKVCGLGFGLPKFGRFCKDWDP